VNTGWVQVGQAGDSPLTPDCDAWQRDVKDGHLMVLVGQEPGLGWHLSISHRTNHRPPRPGRYPKWGEIKDARYRFCPPDIAMCMILPPPEEYVNVHPTTFHLHEHRG
jgi:hypothetical protein